MTRGRSARGFTLIELLVVLAVLAILVGLVTPRYLDRVDEARDAVLRHNLHGLRTAIDQFYRDKGRYPDTLEELVSERYLRAVPQDPITQRVDTWTAVAPQGGSKGIYDVRSGAARNTQDGKDYASW